MDKAEAERVKSYRLRKSASDIKVDHYADSDDSDDEEQIISEAARMPLRRKYRTCGGIASRTCVAAHRTCVPIDNGFVARLKRVYAAYFVIFVLSLTTMIQTVRLSDINIYEGIGPTTKHLEGNLIDNSTLASNEESNTTSDTRVLGDGLNLDMDSSANNALPEMKDNNQNTGTEANDRVVLDGSANMEGGTNINDNNQINPANMPIASNGGDIPMNADNTNQMNGEMTGDNMVPNNFEAAGDNFLRGTNIDGTDQMNPAMNGNMVPITSNGGDIPMNFDNANQMNGEMTSDNMASFNFEAARDNFLRGANNHGTDQMNPAMNGNMVPIESNGGDTPMNFDNTDQMNGEMTSDNVASNNVETAANIAYANQIDAATIMSTLQNLQNDEIIDAGESGESNTVDDELVASLRQSLSLLLESASNNVDGEGENPTSDDASSLLFTNRSQSGLEG